MSSSTKKRVEALLKKVEAMDCKHKLEVLHKNISIQDTHCEYSEVLEAIHRRLIFLDPTRAKGDVSNEIQNLWALIEPKFDWSKNGHKNGVKLGGSQLSGDCSYDEYISYCHKDENGAPVTRVWLQVYINVGEDTPRLCLTRRDGRDRNGWAWKDGLLLDEEICSSSLMKAQSLFVDIMHECLGTDLA